MIDPQTTRSRRDGGPIAILIWLAMALGSFVTIAFHLGYWFPMYCILIAGISLAFGPRIEVWLIERGWVS